MIDLIEYFEKFDSGSPHHRAAINDLMGLIPKELLSKEASWVITFDAAVNELLLYNEKVNER